MLITKNSLPGTYPEKGGVYKQYIDLQKNALSRPVSCSSPPPPPFEKNGGGGGKFFKTYFNNTSKKLFQLFFTYLNSEYIDLSSYGKKK